MNRIPFVIKNLIIINAIVLIATKLTGNYMIEHFALFYPGSPFFKPYQFVTHMFMHGNFVHLLFNMYALFIFGSILEEIWGSKRFLFYFLVTGLGAAALHCLVLWIEASSLQTAIEAGSAEALSKYRSLLGTPTVGASGAVYGVLLGYGMMFPNNVLRLIFPPVSLKAIYFVLIFGAIELVLGLANAGDHVAHFAHLGGMLFGLIIIQYWKKKGRLYN